MRVGEAAQQASHPAHAPDRGRWRARRGSGPRGRRATRGRSRGAGACRASTCRHAAGPPSCRGRRAPAARRRAAPATPMVWAETASASRPRRPACWADASSRMPTRRPGSAGAVAPAEDPAVPLSGSERPTSIRIVVVLPAPLGPRKPVTVPGSQRNVTSETTVRPPSCLVSPLVGSCRQTRGPPGFQPRSAGSPSPSAVADNDFGRGRGSGARLAFVLERWHARRQHALPMACPAGCARAARRRSTPPTRSVAAATASSTRRSTWLRSRSAPPPSRALGRCTRPGCASRRRDRDARLAALAAHPSSRRRDRHRGGLARDPPGLRREPRRHLQRRDPGSWP